MFNQKAGIKKDVLKHVLEPSMGLEQYILTILFPDFYKKNLLFYM
jgi:glycyl-tRNA synthetase (class II)